MDSFDTANDTAALDADLMAFAARRRQQREALEAKVDAEAQAAAKAAAAPQGADSFVEFIEVVAAPVEGAVKVEVDVVDAAAVAPGPTASPEDGVAPGGNPLGVERSDYAVRRVGELSDQLAQLSQAEAFQVTDELRREAEEARKINISAQESAKKAREGAAKPGVKKAGAPAKVTQTEAR